MLGDARSCDEIARRYHCPRCRHKAALVTRWNDQAQSYEVYCGGCGRSEDFTRNKSITEQWRANPESVPNHTANALARKYGVEPLTTQALATVTERAMVQRMEQARWLKDLQPQDRASLAHLAVKYQLDPIMGELIVYEGKPYITLAGMVRNAHASKGFAGLEDRPMSDEEKRQYGLTAPVCWLAKVYRQGWRVPVVGIGTANPNNPLRNNPKEKTEPHTMARSRAIRQALRTAFPQALPFESAEEQAITIDTTTGEIFDAPADYIEGESMEILDTDALLELEQDPDGVDDAHEDEGESIRRGELAKLESIAKSKRIRGGALAAWFVARYRCELESAGVDLLLDAQEALAEWTPSKKATG